jgi:beta-glucosidase
VTLQPGERKQVTFRLRPVDDFAYYDDSRKAFAVDPGPYELRIGASSLDIRQRTVVTIQ